MDDRILTVKNLSIDINGHNILKDINFEAKSNEIIAVIGPNGAGKTTLFRALLGLVPYRGSVEWKPNIKLGYVPQKIYIETDFPLTVKEFFSLKNSDQKEINRVTSSVNLKSDLNHKLGGLSGGELQKVLIAWALIDNPEVLLFDEPTSGIDVSAEESIYDLLHKLQEKEKITIMLISHELQIVYRYATNVICLNKESICFGPPKKALDKDTLEKLFGTEVGLYQHHS